MLLRFGLLGLVLFMTCGAAQAVENWADTAGNDPDFAASKVLCAKAKTVRLPPVSGQAAKNCNSSDLLYGIGHPADPVAARICAVQEAAAGNGDPTGGAATMATIYANGSAVTRDYDVAIAYACQIDGAPAEVNGWVNHLAQLKKTGAGEKPFDICDDITSGAMEGFCAEREGALADAKRQQELSTMAASLTGGSRAAFNKLLEAEQAFVKASVDNEVDVSGTARGALIIGAQQDHETDFIQALRATMAAKLAGSADDARTADKQLNATYDKVMALKDTSDLGTVEKKGIKQTQRIWITYRDAFVAFARTAAPAVSVDAVTTELTRARTKNLRAFLPT